MDKGCPRPEVRSCFFGFADNLLLRDNGVFSQAVPDFRASGPCCYQRKHVTSAVIVERVWAQAGKFVTVRSDSVPEVLGV